MTRYINKDEADAWLKASLAIRKASDELDQAYVTALVSLNGAHESPEVVKRVLSKLRAASETISGLSYMCHPQPEWTGDDKDGNYMGVIRAPHIAQKPGEIK